MIDLTINDLDDDVLKFFEKRARANSRSLEDELRAFLTASAYGPDIVDLKTLIERIDKMITDDTQTDHTDKSRKDQNK